MLETVLVINIYCLYVLHCIREHEIQLIKAFIQSVLAVSLNGAELKLLCLVIWSVMWPSNDVLPDMRELPLSLLRSGWFMQMSFTSLSYYSGSLSRIVMSFMETWLGGLPWWWIAGTPPTTCSAGLTVFSCPSREGPTNFTNVWTTKSVRFSFPTLYLIDYCTYITFSRWVLEGIDYLHQGVPQFEINIYSLSSESSSWLLWKAYELRRATAMVASTVHGWTSMDDP